MALTVNNKRFNKEMKDFELDLRKSARRIIKELSIELVEESVKRVSKHSKTGHMVTTIKEYPETAWTRIVDFGESTYLDEGSIPHVVPIKDAIIMSKYYDMHPDHFANLIKKYGTKPHPFINDAEKAVMDKRVGIYKKELKRVRALNR